MIAGDILALAVIAAASYGGWRLSLRWWPYAPCRWCAGRPGKNPGSTKDRWGKCRHCGGTGRRLRWGARER